jgi:predicted dehydrogenase
LHVPLALEGARRGKHLFVEKPLGNSCDQVRELLDEVEQRELVTLVGCNLRFHPGLRALKQLLEERAVGRVLSARIECGQYLPDWRPAQDYRETYSAKRDLGGGVIFDAIHELDYCRWLLGEIVEVSCVAVNTGALEIETEDVAAILARLASGVIVEIHLDYVSRPPVRACRITGTDGVLEWDFYAAHTRIQRIGTDTWDTVWTNDSWSVNDMYLDELRHFLACVRGTERSTLDVRNAAAVLGVALAAHESAASQRAVVPGRP